MKPSIRLVERMKNFLRKEQLLFLLTLSFVCTANAQQADRLTGARLLTEEAKEYISTFRKFDMTQCRTVSAGELPASVDNSTLKFFPPVINQIGNSCGSASNVHYIFSYEVNRLLDRDGKNLNNVMSYMNVWNHLNDGAGYGVFAFDALDFIKNNGCVSEADFQTESATEWPYGHAIYYNGMQYRVDEYYTLEADVPEDFKAMKAYLADGGVMEFEANTSRGIQEMKYDGASQLGYKYIVPIWGSDGMHAMTIVGYDDTVWYDYDKDGEKDDFEMGAFLCVNSWGERWGDNGRFYSPYHAFTTLKQAAERGKLQEGEGGTGNGGMKLSYIVKPKVVNPQMVLKVFMSHTSRNDLRFTIASGNGTGKEILFMKNQGGDYPLSCSELSKNYMEFSIDITDLVTPGADSYTFSIINTKEGTAGEGELYYCSLLDYGTDAEEPSEFPAVFENGKISGQGREVIKAVINTAMPSFSEGENIILNHVMAKGKMLYVNAFVKEDSYAKIEIMDTGKNTITLLHDDFVKAGTFSVSSDIRALAKGDYILKVITDNNVIYKHFTK